MKRSGKSRPGTVKSPKHCSDLGRGEMVGKSKKGEDNNSKKFDCKSCSQPGGLWLPKREAVQLFGPDEMMRARLIWLTFGLIGTVLVGGLTALTTVTLLGGSSGVILEFLKMVIGPTFALATFAAGFYFGRRPERGGRS